MKRVRGGIKEKKKIPVLTAFNEIDTAYSDSSAAVVKLNNTIKK